MARIEQIHVVGKIGNVICYTRLGKQVVRSVPAALKQTAATKTSSSRFGIASSAGTRLWKLLVPIRPVANDSDARGPFIGAITKWLKLYDIQDIPAMGSLPFIHQFSFSAKTSISERCAIKLLCEQRSDDTIEIKIPEFVPIKAIRAPASAATVHCTFTVVACSLTDKAISHSHTESRSFAFTEMAEPAQSILFPVNAMKGCLIIAAASMTYTLKNGKNETRPGFLPSSVIGSWYTG